jgi:excisionase family DNA binding protein
MKTHPTQFGVRENTASLGQHDLRLATDVHSKLIRTEQQVPSTRISPPENEPPATDSETELHAAQQRAATGGENNEETRLLTVHEVAMMLRVPVSWVYTRVSKASIDKLPYVKIGKYIRFEKSAVIEFVRRHHRA